MSLTDATGLYMYAQCARLGCPHHSSDSTKWRKVKGKVLDLLALELLWTTIISDANGEQPAGPTLFLHQAAISTTSRLGWCHKLLSALAKDQGAMLLTVLCALSTDSGKMHCTHPPFPKHRTGLVQMSHQPQHHMQHQPQHHMQRFAIFAIFNM